MRGEMEAVKDKVGFEGDLQAFFKFVRDRPALQLFPNTDAGRQGYIDEATQAIATIKQQLPKYFGLLPKADLVVKRVEPFREQSTAPRSITTRARRTARARACTTRTCPT